MNQEVQSQAHSSKSKRNQNGKPESSETGIKDDEKHKMVTETEGYALMELKRVNDQLEQYIDEKKCTFMKKVFCA